MAARRPRTVALTTVGCKLNQYETEGIAELFEREGLRVVPFDGPADIYVVNTCTVTTRSDYRSRQMIRRAARRNPTSTVVATGCYAQRDPATLAALPEVALVVGNTDKPSLAAIALEAAERAAEMGDGAAGDGEPPRVVVSPFAGDRFQAFDIDGFRGYTRAFVKIQDGCDARCAYCAVPDARGPARSRPFADVLEQAERLVRNGYRELVLTGVHIGGYADPEGRALADLLHALSKKEGLERVRLGSVEPRELTPALAAAVLSLGKICKHLHVPLESGSDRVLERMGRGYTRDDYAAAVARVTDHDPRAGLGADVMVGFPGETDEDFADTVELIERLPFTYLHVFAFSPRAGTPAAAMDGVVPAAEKKRRSRALRDLGLRKSLAFREGLTGKTVEILVEEGSDRGGAPLSGLADNYVRVEVGGPASLKGKLVRARIEGADDARTWGTAEPGTVR